jgi:hypothetical protein
MHEINDCSICGEGVDYSPPSADDPAELDWIVWEEFCGLIARMGWAAQEIWLNAPERTQTMFKLLMAKGVHPFSAAMIFFGCYAVPDGVVIITNNPEERD